MLRDLTTMNDAGTRRRDQLDAPAENKYSHQTAARVRPPSDLNDLRARARPPGISHAELENEPVEHAASEPVPVDDCERLGTLFGELNKCLRGIGFTQLYFGEKVVEPVVVLLFWLLLWFLGIQALGLVGTLCIVIIYIQK